MLGLRYTLNFKRNRITDAGFSHWNNAKQQTEGKTISTKAFLADFQDAQFTISVSNTIGTQTYNVARVFVENY